MTAILGISAFYHDSAAAIVVDGKIIAAAQEERFTRRKHDPKFPLNAIEYCLEEAKLNPNELDYVAFYDKPFLKFERLLETYLSYAPAGFRSFLMAMPLWLHHKLHLPREMSHGLNNLYIKKYIFTEHHESHAASAFFPSPFTEAAILTLDGVGEWATVSFGTGSNNQINLTHELHFPHSLGLLYSAFTYFCGFRVNSGEYKLMGLAPYGEPIFANAIEEKLLDIKEDGSFRMDMSYFNYCQGLTMTGPKFDALFGGPPRKYESPLTQREMDLAASIQAVTENIMLRICNHVQNNTGLKNLCLAGGVALNCVGNGRILRESSFENVWIQPASGDAGGALGAALFTWYQLLGNKRSRCLPDSQRASLLGPQFSAEEILSLLEAEGSKFHHIRDEDKLCDTIADLIASEKVIGLFQGRMEFGPRALGCRSIIGDPRSQKMQSTMNLKIKFRESFRPFAPIILRERVSEYFNMRPNEDSPYMLLVAPVAAQKRLAAKNIRRKGLMKLKDIRSEVPAITHVDYSARIQTVDEERHGRLYKLMKSFEAKTGCPVLINTSFNVRGEPIVCSPEHAFRCFMATNMDVLVLENFVLLKEEQSNATEHEIGEYLAQFPSD
ncbi:MAG: Decarbamoylnovobiocin carbamoyltransferase [Candidatus Moanabacter tarae]|uniref:Decarbamoylnovobiocin carbamoyltransferase n=1 Tax=Candidatus Moanibacter tarae TaxID=2200854 RepID=A0A2Z4AK62_9BACT|nr:MAG: Decarbamoylnovobiocin carbamoyltransferase [Candidatus Moanabacter tarae]|tara:strand:+ start:34689 stop:36521 length:1833 start_codon:yes stop_codon:yes gene_type:complete